jgi:pimeloyl-ACP methyl ester carboxylesterase
MGPETRYAKTVDGAHIAYQVVGEGSVDLVFVLGWTSNIEAIWEEPGLARFLARLAAVSRLIIFDKRGTGLSDRVSDTDFPTFETRMDDVRAVMDAAGSKRAVVFGVSEGGPLSILYAATHAQRVIGLILFGTSPRFAWAPDYPWGTTEEQHQLMLDEIDREWGTEEYAARQIREWGAPTQPEDPQLVSWLAGYLRRAASPGAAIALERMNVGMDVRDVLPAVHVPTLVLSREGDRDFPADATRKMAEAIPGSRLVELPGADHFFWVGHPKGLLDEIEQFLKELGDDEDELDRVLATVLFTDIVRSTEPTAELGDRQWRRVLEEHNRRIRALIGRFRGREVDTAGDGFVATFDGPIRAARCALAAVEAVRDIDVEIRAGLHTGEVEMAGNQVQGIAVNIGARVAALAGPSEVLASSTVKDLVAGSTLGFEDRGTYELKGVPARGGCTR